MGIKKRFIDFLLKNQVILKNNKWFILTLKYFENLLNFSELWKSLRKGQRFREFHKGIPAKRSRFQNNRSVSIVWCVHITVVKKKATHLKWKSIKLLKVKSITFKEVQNRLPHYLFTPLMNKIPHFSLPIFSPGSKNFKCLKILPKNWLVTLELELFTSLYEY